jgi:hypothetical protein
VSDAAQQRVAADRRDNAAPAERRRSAMRIGHIDRWKKPARNGGELERWDRGYV